MCGVNEVEESLLKIEVKQEKMQQEGCAASPLKVRIPVEIDSLDASNFEETSGAKDNPEAGAKENSEEPGEVKDKLGKLALVITLFFLKKSVFYSEVSTLIQY